MPWQQTRSGGWKAEAEGGVVAVVEPVGWANCEVAWEWWLVIPPDRPWPARFRRRHPCGNPDEGKAAAEREIDQLAAEIL